MTVPRPRGGGLQWRTSELVGIWELIVDVGGFGSVVGKEPGREISVSIGYHRTGLRPGFIANA
jgi:hypothetical protein